MAKCSRTIPRPCGGSRPGRATRRTCGGNRRRRSWRDQRLARPHRSGELIAVQQAEQGAPHLGLGVVGVTRADPLCGDLSYVLAHAEADADARLWAHAPVGLQLRLVGFRRGVEVAHARTLPEAAAAVDQDHLRGSAPRIGSVAVAVAVAVAVPRARSGPRRRPRLTPMLGEGALCGGNRPKIDATGRGIGSCARPM
jgi:hypothetical protein